MGIDPLTHKPISSISDESQDPQQPEPAANNEKLAEEKTNTSNTSCSNSPSTCATTTTIDPIDQVDAFLSKSPAFCTDEVPMIQPHEILVPAPCSSSSSISSSSNWSSNSSAKAEEIQLPCMEWQESMYLWGLDDLMGWDSLCCDDVDGKLALDPFTSTQYLSSAATAFDQEAWKFELFWFGFLAFFFLLFCFSFSHLGFVVCAYRYNKRTCQALWKSQVLTFLFLSLFFFCLLQENRISGAEKEREREVMHAVAVNFLLILAKCIESS